MMSDDNEGEKRDQDRILNWWVRYAFVPITVALIAGISAVKAAELLGNQATEPPAITATSGPAQTVERRTGLPDTSGPAATVEMTPTETPLPTETPSPSPAVAPAATQAPVTSLLGHHVVQRGEHLYCIGRAYGVPPEAIAQANHLVRPSNLSVGQVLGIPAVQWIVIPSGPVCQRQFDSPFTRDSTVVSIPAPTQSPIYPPTDTQVPADIPALPTPTPTTGIPVLPTLTPTVDTPVPPTPTPTAGPYPVWSETPVPGIDAPTQTAVAR